MRIPKSRRIFPVFSIALFLGVQFLSLFAFVQPANAIAQQVIAGAAAGSASMKVQDLGLLAYFQGQDVQYTFTQALYASGLKVLVRAASRYAQDLAYKTAMYVSTGGKGKSPLAFQDSFGDYLETAALDTVAEGIEDLGKEFGLNLCSIPDLNVRIALQIGLRSAYMGPAQPGRCTWQQLRNNWTPENFEKKYGMNSKDMDAYFANAIKITDTDFGIATQAIATLDQNKLIARETNALERLAGDGFKSVKSLISGKILTPASMVADDAKRQLTASAQGDTTEAQITALYAADAVEIFPMAASVFLNTLAQEMLKKLFTKGLLPDSGNGSAFSFDMDIRFGDNRERAEREFAFLRAASVIQERTIDILDEFQVCTDNPNLNNCVIDEGFADAVRQYDRTGEAMTLQEAVEAGLIDGSKRLISPLRETDHQNIQECYKLGFCYSNVQKLRRQRILPLGFEIATLRADPDNPPTLSEVMGNYENCPFVRDANGNLEKDANGDPIMNENDLNQLQYRFCHLINPNWVLKAPASRCESLGWGPQLAGEGLSIRNEECFDVSTCIEENPDGSCKTDSAYGYCLEEKNIWKIPGQSCAPQYATCVTYRGNDGSVSSYLSRTLDFGECNSSSVGCLAYSTEKDENGNWITSFESQTEESKLLKQYGRNQVVFLNPNVNNAICSSVDAGCTALYLDANNTSEKIFIKRAPDYLGCYDIDRDTPQIDWPATNVDILNKLSDNPACDQYSKVCLEEELDCELYTPKDGGPSVPGIIGINSCDSQCIGYDTYKQMATKFESEKFPTYIIPSRGESCQASEVGCDQFTNIESLDAGGEQIVNLSFMRYCEKPSVNNSNEGTFYTWEGSATEGYVIRTHKLLVIDEEVHTYMNALANDLEFTMDNFPVGSPAYDDDSVATLNSYVGECNESSYLNRINGVQNPGPDTIIADENCKEFFDDAGNKFYRLINNTVVVSEFCQRMRKTESELYVDTYIQNDGMCSDRGGYFAPSAENPNGGSVCQRCTGGGDYVNGVCVYQTILDGNNSRECSPQAVTCREFVGNLGNNQSAPLYQTDFEPLEENEEALNQVLSGWGVQNGGDFRAVAEANNVGFHSLEVDTQELFYTVPANILQAEKSGVTYKIEFWARGGNQSIQVYLRQGNEIVGRFTMEDQSLSIENNWQYYEIGPAIFTGDITADTQIVFERTGGNGAYYLDYLSVKPQSGKLYLKKTNSNAVRLTSDIPLVCDNQPDDGLPGSALGCRLYTNSLGDDRPATGFENICRMDAVGCTKVYDTESSTDTGNDFDSGDNLRKVFNAKCVQAGNERNTNLCSVKVGDENFSCEVLPTKDSCYIPGEMILPKEYVIADTLEIKDGEGNSLQSQLFIDESSVVLPGDSHALYLTYTPEVSCKESAVGCTEVAQQVQVGQDETADASFSFNPMYVVMKPELFTDALCNNALMGCSEFTTDSGMSYFKDPRIIGNKFCVYKDGTDGTTAGWYRKDDETEPCYPNYLERDTPMGTIQGLWSNSSGINYKGFVGTCSQADNRCTEIVDPNDKTDKNPKGQPYYVIFDDEITSRKDECGQQVSLNEGCVLFDKTDEPNRMYNTQASYDLSTENNYELVSAVSAPQDESDANIILKVMRDRECSEWLDCRSKVVNTKPDGQKQILCYEYGVCDATDGYNCTHWISKDIYGEGTGPLDFSQYATRDTSWNGRDYTGYSLYNKRHISFLKYYINIPGKDTTYIGFKMPDYVFIDADQDKGCKNNGNGSAKADWISCGLDNNGRCISGDCIYPIDGDFPQNMRGVENQEKLLSSLNGGTCKAFPEQDSPYSSSIVSQWNTLKNENQPTLPTRKDAVETDQGMDGANTCQNGECSCAYRRVTYKNGLTDFHGLTEKYAPGVCSGGDLDGSPCFSSTDCTTYAGDLPRNANGEQQGQGIDGNAIISQGECNNIESIGTWIGLEGYCLEYDYSRPLTGGNGYACLTWLPIDASAAKKDIYNINIEAGYDPAVDAVNDQGIASGEVYCAAGTSIGSGTYVEGYGSRGLHNIRETNGTMLYDRGAVSTDELVYTPSATTVDPSTVDTDEPISRTFYDAYFTEPAFPQPEYYDAGPSSAVMVDTGRPWVTDRSVIVGYNEVPEMEQVGMNNVATGNMILAPVSVSVSSMYAKIYDGARASLSYTPMQYWAWRNIAKNAVVLRTEQMDKDQSYVGDKVSLLADSGRMTYKRVNIFRNFMAVEAENQDEWGTIMHPPRLWTDPRNNETQDKLDTYYVMPAEVMNSGAVGQDWLYVDYEVDGSEFKIPRVFMTKYHSPEIYNDKVYNPAYELYLNENQIQDIFFVLTSSMGDRDDFRNASFPAIYTRQLNIDFLGLKDASNRAMAKYVGTAGYDDNGAGVTDRVETAVQDDIYAGIWWTYMLQRDVGDGLLSFDDYTYGGGTVYGTKLADPNADEMRQAMINSRNEIYRRYVGVFSNGGKDTVPMIDFIQSNVVGEVRAPGKDTDPFTVACPNNTEEDVNFLVLGLDFNKEGEFLGYITRWCGAAEDDDIGGSMGVVATLTDTCTQFAQVYNPEGDVISKDTNKAWTDKVWKDADNGSSRGSVVPKEQAMPLYGSLPIKAQDFSSAVNAITNGEIAPEQQLLQRVGYFRYGDLDGVPFKCEDNYGGFSYFPDPTGGQKGNCSAIGMNHKNRYRYIDDVLLRIANQEKESISAGKKINGKYLTLSNYFSKMYKTLTRNFTRSGIGYTNADAVAYGKSARGIGNIVINLDLPLERGSYDFSGLDKNNRVFYGNLFEPQVYSLNPSCFTDPSKPCVAGDRYAFTVSGRTGLDTDYNGDGFAPDEQEDRNLDGKVDPMIFAGYHTAVVRFFAYADNDRMPIRSLKLDWRDGTEILNNDRVGLYKNKKPYCQDSASGGEGTFGYCAGVKFDGYSTEYISQTQLTCYKDSDCPQETYLFALNNPQKEITIQKCIPLIDEQHFGDSSRACEQGYYEFAHSYVCNKKDIEASSARDWVKLVRDFDQDTEKALMDRGLGLDDKVCVYKPRVQVTDNWGWCNGECGYPNNGSQKDNVINGRVDREDLFLQNPANLNDGVTYQGTATGNVTGCYSEVKNNRGVEEDQCDLRDDFPNYTEFAGEIIVIPE